MSTKMKVENTKTLALVKATKINNNPEDTRIFHYCTGDNGKIYVDYLYSYKNDTHRLKLAGADELKALRELHII